MRIKQKQLKKYKPDASYTKLVNGIEAKVDVYSQPCYCVNIQHWDNKACYPISFAQYLMYCQEAEETIHPSVHIIEHKIARLERLIKETSDVRLKKFYTNAINCYRR